MTMFVNRSAIVSATIVFYVTVCICVNIDKCTTPNGQSAECISIQKCSILLDALKTKDETAIEFAKKSQCGYDKAPLVCCGTTANYTKSVTVLYTDMLPNRRYCGLQHYDDYVSKSNAENGSSSINEFPWLAALFYTVEEKVTEENLCAGSLITNRYVLTTAHCVTDPKHNLTKVRLGEYNINIQDDCVSDGQLDECSDPIADFGIEETIVYPKYKRASHLYDVALIRLNKRVQYSDYVRPICLPVPGTPQVKAGDTCAQSGWGRISSFGEPVDIKKKVLSKIIALENCIATYKLLGFNLTDDHVCTKEIDLSNPSCQGDSGGPIMFSHKNQWFQEGIISFGIGCGAGNPDVSAKVSKYVEWIVRTLRA